MRSVAAAALAFALAACGGSSDDGQLAAGNSQLTNAQIDAALGPADQSSEQDINKDENAADGANVSGNEAASADSSIGDGDRDEDER